ncbi:MAG: NADH-quinone oxidoreductase subunit N [Candidatus Sumerlaeia bacterium]|nr:NADH-quinone oxidoreductase subunit N [Candidatus Sumerlaeia bacterium]
MDNFVLFLPETLALLTALAVFLLPIAGASHRAAWGTAIGGGLAMLVAATATLSMTGEPFFPGIYHVDFFSQAMKVIFSAGLVLVLMLGGDPPTIRRGAWPEYPLFLLFSTVGMMMLVSATELLTLYIALELSAYPLYVLVALNRQVRTGSESAAKYMLQGMVASAMTIYGMSFLFGFAQSTYLADIAARLPEVADQPLFWFGMALTLAGFLFKLATFPFHFWAPDTYQGAPHTVVTFIATSSKVATVAVLCRVITLLADHADGGTGESLRTALLFCALAAMTIGNLAALVQKDLKRLLGYSAAAHAGYLLIALQAFSPLGVTSALFYVLGYFAMSYLVFFVVCTVARERDLVGIDALSGLGRRSPFLGLCLLIGVFGLTGLPPTVGFIGKWFLFSAALERGQFLAVLIAALNSVVALYYYLRLIRQAYLVPPADDAAGRVPLAPLATAAAALSCIVVVWMGTAPNAFWQAARAAANALAMTP